jgi:hypothetical protein
LERRRLVGRTSRTVPSYGTAQQVGRFVHCKFPLRGMLPRYLHQQAFARASAS